MNKLPTKEQLDEMRAALSTMNYFCNRKCNQCSINDRLDDEETCPVTTLEGIIESIQEDIINNYYEQQNRVVKGE